MRKVGIFFVSSVLVLALVVAAALIAPNFIGWNEYKPLVIESVKKATGQDLRLDGDIALQILPLPAFHIQDVGLQNVAEGTAGEMLKLQDLKVRVALMPLFQNRVEVLDVVLQQPEILVEQFADGRLNWAVLGKSAPASTQSTSTVSSPSAVTKTENLNTDFLALNDIRIEKGTVTYIKHISADKTTTQTLKDISLQIKNGRITGPFDVAFSVLTEAGELKGTFTSGAIKNNTLSDAKVSLALKDGVGTLLETDFAGTMVLAPNLSVQGKININVSSPKTALAVLQKFDPSFDSEALLASLPMKSEFWGEGITAVADVSAATDPAKTTLLKLQNLKMTTFGGALDGSVQAVLPNGAVQPPQITVALNASYPDLDKVLAPNGLQVKPVSKQSLDSAAVSNPVPAQNPSVATPVKASPVLGLDLSLVLQNTVLGGKPLQQFKVALSAMGDKLTVRELDIRWPNVMIVDANVAVITSPSGISGQVAAQVYDLPFLTKWLGLEGVEIPPAFRGELAFNGKVAGRLTSGATEIALNTFIFKTTTNEFRGNLNILPSGKVLKVTGDVSTDALSIDALTGGTDTASQGSGQQGANNGAPTTAQNAAPKNMEASREPIDLGFLDTLDLDLRLAASSIQSGTTKATNVSLKAAVNPRGIKIENLIGQAYGGSFSGRADITRGSAAQDPHSLTTQINVKQFHIPEVLNTPQAAANGNKAASAYLAGKADLVLDLASRGQSKYDLLSTLSGTGKFTLTDGKLVGINLNALSDRLKSLDISQTGNIATLITEATSNGGQAGLGIFGGGDTDIDTVEAILNIKDGVVRSDNTKVGFANGFVDVNSMVNLPEQQLDIVGACRLPKISDVPLPIRLSGALSKPKLSIDTSTLAKAVAQKVVQDVVKDKAGAIIQDKLPDALKSGVGGQLLNSFIGGGNTAAPEAVPTETPPPVIDPSIVPAAEPPAPAPIPPAAETVPSGTAPAEVPPADPIPAQPEPDQTEEAVKGLLNNFLSQ